MANLDKQLDIWVLFPELLSRIVWLLPIALFFVYNYTKKTIENGKHYTACNSPSCARCNKYDAIRKSAEDRMKHFVQEGTLKKSIQQVINGFDPDLDMDNIKQKPNVFYMPGLSPKPFWIWDSCSNTLRHTVKLMENNYKEVLEEFQFIHKQQNLWTENQAKNGKWKTFYLYNQGIKNVDNCLKCPKTSVVLDQLDNFMRDSIFGNALFSVVEPGTKITPHYGPTNVRLRCHLGLIIPKGVSLTVNSIKGTWEEGKCIVFDDSFLHSVENTERVQSRAVFIFDIWHPDLTDIEYKTLLKLFDETAENK